MSGQRAQQSGCAIGNLIFTKFLFGMVFYDFLRWKWGNGL